MTGKQFEIIHGGLCIQARIDVFAVAAAQFTAPDCNAESDREPEFLFQLWRALLDQPGTAGRADGRGGYLVGAGKPNGQTKLPNDYTVVRDFIENQRVTA